MATASRPFDQPIFVSERLPPPLAAYAARLAQAWEAKRSTSGGARHCALETALPECLRAPHLSVLANGMLALLAYGLRRH